MRLRIGEGGWVNQYAELEGFDFSELTSEMVTKGVKLTLVVETVLEGAGVEMSESFVELRIVRAAVMEMETF